jgi:hypothetical protein
MDMPSPNYTKRFGPLSTFGVNTPAHLAVRATKANLLTDFHQFGYAGEQFFGTAFIQGNRLQFTTAMPFSTMLKVSKIDRAPSGSGVNIAMEKANRPKIAGHAKALRQYLIDTACRGEKFVLPAFTFNFGDEHSTPEDAPEAVLYVYGDETENSTNGWPALFQLPNTIKLDTTDGAHRGGEIDSLLNDRGLSLQEVERSNLGRNACDVKIIFESKRVDAHQDFADCAKAKQITGSLISTFDVRDLRNQRAVNLVRNVGFLQHYVDATAANVNLSAKSLKIWSMSAVRGFVGHVQDRYPPAMGASEPQVEASLTEKLCGAEEFFAAVIEHIPQLHTLDLARTDPKTHTETAATYRSKLGGSILLRGVGMSLLARAFVHVKQYGLPTMAGYVDMATKLGMVDWFLLDCERDQLPDSETEAGRLIYAEEVRKHTNPLWASMMVIGESRYRIGSSSEEANQAWSRVLAKIEPETAAADIAAE